MTQKIYLHQNVYEAAIDRIRWLFAEFPNVVVNFSGGKDSTVILNLTLQVAEELGRLPLKVMFIDQEVELGMEPEELIKLKHITGFSKLFENTEYKKAWKTKRQILIEKEFRDRPDDQPAPAESTISSK